MKKFFLYATIIIAAHQTSDAQNLTGTVSCDNKPLSGVIVSDGDKFAKTDSDGRYSITSKKKSGTVFVITPSGYIVESKKGFQPDFWATISTNTDSLEVNDFKLIKESQDSFCIIFTADSHLTDDPVKKDFLHYKEMVLPTAARIVSDNRQAGKAIYSINLGDLSHDLYWYSNNTQIEKVVDFITEEGFPALTYSVPGNHDNDPAVTGKNVDSRAIERYHKQLGPDTYSINIGNTHWIMLDDVIYRNRPGKGKTAKGVAGDRSYKNGLTSRQFEWIKKDLSYIPDSTRIFICCHVPILIDNNDGSAFSKHEQVDSLANMLKRFGEVTVFSGHSHKNLYQENERWPNLRQFVLTATSGVMWLTTNNFQTIGSDGSTTGLWVGRFCPDTPVRMDYYTYDGTDALFRCYDLNEVGKYYAGNPTVRKMMEIYPERIDYSKKKYNNMVYVNFWGDRTGRRIEILENGTPLEVRKVRWEDPLYVMSYYIPEIEKDSTFRNKFKRKHNSHAYVVRTSSGDSELQIRIYEPDGTLIQSQTMSRPKIFNKNAR